MALLHFAFWWIHQNCIFDHFYSLADTRNRCIGAGCNFDCFSFFWTFFLCFSIEDQRIHQLWAWLEVGLECKHKTLYHSQLVNVCFNVPRWRWLHLKISIFCFPNFKKWVTVIVGAEQVDAGLWRGSSPLSLLKKKQRCSATSSRSCGGSKIQVEVDFYRFSIFLSYSFSLFFF